MGTVTPFKKKSANLTIKCSGCGIIAAAPCDCGKPLLPAYERASKGIQETPDATHAAIAKRMGVDEKSVRTVRARSEGSTKPAHAGMSSCTALAKEAVAKSPKKPNTTIARELGVSEMTVRRARKELEAEADKPPVEGPRKPPKPPKIEPNVIKQASNFHTELTTLTQEFCARIKAWHAANPIDDESHFCVVRALEMASMRLQETAQDIDDR